MKVGSPPDRISIGFPILMTSASTTSTLLWCTQPFVVELADIHLQSYVSLRLLDIPFFSDLRIPENSGKARIFSRKIPEFYFPGFLQKIILAFPGIFPNFGNFPGISGIFPEKESKFPGKIPDFWGFSRNFARFQNSGIPGKFPEF